MIDDQVDDVDEPPALQAVPAADPLARLRTLRKRRRELDQEIRDAVAEAQGSKISWHRIGLVMGLTAEGARKRWGRR